MSDFPNAVDGCVRCGDPLIPHGVVNFRTGGTTGVANFLLGEWGEVGEQFLALLALYCGTCGRVEFRVPPRD